MKLVEGYSYNYKSIRD